LIDFEGQIYDCNIGDNRKDYKMQTLNGMDKMDDKNNANLEEALKTNYF